MTTSLYNNIAIQMHTQPLNNRTVKHYGAIFRHVREDFIDITTRARMCRETHCIGLNLKCWFCQSIKRKPRKQIPLFGGIKLMHYFLFGLFNFSRQAPITQAEKLVFSFLDCSSTCSIKSCGKRIAFLFDLLFLLPVAIIRSHTCSTVFAHYTLISNKQKVLTWGHTLKYSEHTPREYARSINNDSPKYWHTMSYLTTITLIEVMIMANSNDTLCPKNGQYDLPNLLSVLNLYQADIQPQNLLHAKAHLEELRQSILWGIGAIGNLLFWASECEEYEEQQFKDDIRDIGYLLAQLKNVACFASNQINLLDDKLNHKEVNYNE